VFTFVGTHFLLVRTWHAIIPGVSSICTDVLVIKSDCTVITSFRRSGRATLRMTLTGCRQKLLVSSWTTPGREESCYEEFKHPSPQANHCAQASKATLFALQISRFCANYWLAHEHDGGMRWLCRRSYSAVLLGCSATGRLEANMQRCWYTLNELRQLGFHLATGKHAETLVYTQRASTAWFPPRLMILSTYSFLNSWESLINSMGTRE